MWENGGSKYRGSSSRGPRYSVPGSLAIPLCPAIESQRQSVELRKRLNPGPRNCKRVSIAGTVNLGPGPVEIESRFEARGTEIESRFFDSRVDADGSAQARVDADRSALVIETETHHKRHLGVSLCPVGSLSGSREETPSQHKGLIKLAGENASQSAEGDAGRHI